VGRAALKGAGAGAGAWAGAAAGAAIGSVVPVVGTLIGGLIGGALGAYGGGKLADLDTYGVEDGIFGGSKKSRRAILEGKNVTPIDSKDDILAMKPGGIVDKVMSKNTGVNTVKHEFGTLNISGEITLNVPGNEKININLAKSPEFVREITRMVHVEAAKIKNQIQKG
jgi:hypothetical protein